MASPSIDLELRPKAIAIHDRLCAEYGCPIPYFHGLDPLSELVSSLLSHRTKNRDSGRAFKQLIAQFPTWEAVRDAPTAAVEAAIAPCTHHEVMMLHGQRCCFYKKPACDRCAVLSMCPYGQRLSDTKSELHNPDSQKAKA